MFRLSALRLPLVALTLACSATLVSAQTGPKKTGGSKMPAGPGGGSNPALVTFTPQSMAAYLQKKGYTTKYMKDKEGKVIGLTAAIKTTDDWEFLLEIEFFPKLNRYAILTALRDASGLSADRLLKLLKWNYDGPCNAFRFSYRESDGKLCYELPNNSAVTTAAGFDADLQVFMQTIKNSYNLWGN
jgi:hypothetical protein